MRSRAAGVALLAYLVGLGLLVLWPTHPDALWQPFTQSLILRFQASPATNWIGFGTLNDAANFVLFLPVGLIAILAFGSRRWWVVFLIGCGGSFGAELVQALFLKGRTPDLTDAIFGSIGALVGVGIGCGIVALRTRARARSKSPAAA